MAMLRALLLLPFRMSVALFWIVASAVAWGRYPGWFYPSCAPVFFGESDRFVLYLKRLSWNEYAMMRLDLTQAESDVLYKSKLPIHTFELRSNELALGSYMNGNISYTMFSLDKLEMLTTTRVIRSTIFKEKLMPKTFGFISCNVTCTDNECFTEFRAVTPEGSVLIGPRHPGRVLEDPCLSNDEQLLAFSYEGNVYISNLVTGKQTMVSLGKHRVSNWSHTHVLLACNVEKNTLVLIDANDAAEHQIELPASDAKLRNGVLSPSGRYVVYWGITNALEATQGTYLACYSVNQESHSMLGRWAMIRDVHWSPTERYLSVSGVRRRDIFEIELGRKMRNAYTHDKEIISLDGRHVAICA